MRIPFAILALALGTLAGCSTTPAGKHQGSPETVMITYRVKPGKAAELKAVLERAWTIYRREGLVIAQPHVIVQKEEKGGGLEFVEIFSWINADAPDHVPDSIKTIWNEMQAACESRDGHHGLEGGPVDLLTN